MVTVFELAKKLNISTKMLIEMLRQDGIVVEGHMSEVDESAAKKIEDALSDPDLIEARYSTKAFDIEELESVKRSAEAKMRQKLASKARIKRAQQKSSGLSQVAEVVEAKKLPSEVEVEGGITVKELAERIGRPPGELIKWLMKYGEMVTINQPLSEEAVMVLAGELGFRVKFKEPEETLVAKEEIEETAGLEKRPPVVTVMGHVDHGKTSLLDAIRETNVAEKEAGGITQHIGAYQVKSGGSRITFLDTPGHEAFTQMRARGAHVTDIAVIVVAADDGVMPQTVEAINHAKAAGVPIIFAINKIDLPNANVERTKRQLADLGFIPEEWGGKAVMVEISAKKKINIDELLEMILIVAELSELRADPNRPATGHVIESKLDRGRGPVATLLVRNGTLRVGDFVVAGLQYGKVRSMITDSGDKTDKALPSQPVEVIGFNGVPEAGDEFFVVSSEKEAKSIVTERSLKQRAQALSRVRRITLDDISRMVKEGTRTELPLIIKTDVDGSIDALKQALSKLETNEVSLRFIHEGVGAISETDVLLASASNALIIGFNVRPTPQARKLASLEGVEIKCYRIIYEVIDDVRAAISGMVKPKKVEVEIGSCVVRQIFKVPKVGIAAGCYVESGEIRRNANARLIRDGKVIYDGKIASLRRFKEDVRSVAQGFECGIVLEGFQDIAPGDIIEAYSYEEMPAV